MALPSIEVRERLAQAPVREIVGVANAWGAFVGRAGQQPWELKIVLEPWKVAAGELMNGRLALYKQGEFEEFRPIRGQVKPFTVWRVRAHVVEELGDAWIAEIVGEDESDAELNAIAERLRAPVVLKDDRFGEFTLNRLMKLFEGLTTWCSDPVELRLRVGRDLNPEPALKVAHELWGAEQGWNQRIYDYAVLKLLDLSLRWRQSEDQEITEETFRRRLKLRQVVVLPDGRFEYWFNADGMFTGHAVRVGGALPKGLLLPGSKARVQAAQIRMNGCGVELV